MVGFIVDYGIKLSPNRFEVAVAAPKRARQIALGATPLVDANKDKPTVIALREIASGKVGKELLNPPVPTPPVRVGGTRWGRSISMVGPSTSAAGQTIRTSKAWR